MWLWTPQAELVGCSTVQWRSHGKDNMLPDRSVSESSERAPTNAVGGECPPAIVQIEIAHSD